MNDRPISSVHFSKHHWSVFAYVVEKCQKGAQGVGLIEPGSMRCNENRHGKWKPENSLLLWREDHSTQIKGLQIIGHDDWDCLSDLESMGWLERMPASSFSVRLKPAGCVIAKKLKEHLASGGLLKNFFYE